MTLAKREAPETPFGRPGSEVFKHVCLNMFQKCLNVPIALCWGGGVMWEAEERPFGRPGREMLKHTCLNVFKRSC